MSLPKRMMTPWRNNSISDTLKHPLIGMSISYGVYKHNQVFMKSACALHFNHIFLRQGEKPNEG